MTIIQDKLSLSIQENNYNDNLIIKKDESLLSLQINDNSYKRIYFLCGNTRTFLSCFNSIYKNIIDKLFIDNNKDNTYVLLYLKCDDPGPKKQKNWNFTYPSINKQKLKKKIFDFTERYKNIHFYSEILETNKINDNQIFKQIKNRKLYKRFLNSDTKLIRAAQFHYNIEDCGKIIEEIEFQNKINFDFYIFIRPDLFFSNPCKNISKYDVNKVITGKASWKCRIADHVAIIPRRYKNKFFYDRMKLLRHNSNVKLNTCEEIYLHTIKNVCYVTDIGKYYIKRK